MDSLVAFRMADVKAPTKLASIGSQGLNRKALAGSLDAANPHARMSCVAEAYLHPAAGIPTTEI